MEPDKDFNSFYLYYLSEHRKAMTRAFHFFGTFLVLILFIYGCFISWKAFLLMPLAGYGFAWLSHVFIERNKPATFTHPWWSLKSDFIMFRDIINGNIRKKMQEAQDAFPKP